MTKQEKEREGERKQNVHDTRKYTFTETQSEKNEKSRVQRFNSEEEHLVRSQASNDGCNEQINISLSHLTPFQ